jgi:hypothetical protein
MLMLALYCNIDIAILQPTLVGAAKRGFWGL